jgi:Rieske Fe-S protein
MSGIRAGHPRSARAVSQAVQLMMFKGLGGPKRSKGQDVERCTEEDQEQGTNKDEALAFAGLCWHLLCFLLGVQSRGVAGSKRWWHPIQ